MVIGFNLRADLLLVELGAAAGVFLEPGRPCRNATGRDTLASLGDSIRVANVANRSNKIVGQSVNPMILGDGMGHCGSSWFWRVLRLENRS